MSEAEVRTPRKNETAALKDLWKTVFGRIGVDAFFHRFFDTELCIVAGGTDTPAAVGYLLPVGNIAFGTESYRCAMIYSVATLPAYRSRGLATAVVRKLISLAHELSYPAVALCPSDDKLFEFYKRHTELREWFYVNEFVVNKAPAGTCTYSPAEVTANEYHFLREESLKGITHIEHDLHTLDYQVQLCSELGGGLFRVGDNAAVVERQPDGAVWIKELLIPGDDVSGFDLDNRVTDVLVSIASRFPANVYKVRSPSQIGSNRRFGMISFPDNSYIESFDNDSKPWFGMAFD